MKPVPRPDLDAATGLKGITSTNTQLFYHGFSAILPNAESRKGLAADRIFDLELSVALESFKSKKPWNPSDPNWREPGFIRCELCNGHGSFSNGRGCSACNYTGQIKQGIDPGRDAYEADLAAQPFYHDGTRRPEWSSLDQMYRDSWNKNSTYRRKLDRDYTVMTLHAACKEVWIAWNAIPFDQKTMDKAVSDMGCSMAAR